MPQCSSLARVIAGVCVAALAGASCSSRNIHPELREDPHVLVRRWTLPTRPSLSVEGDRGIEYSNPVVYENTLIFGNRSVGLLALYPRMMENRWSLSIKGGVISELTVDRSSVYFGGGDGYLYSVNAETGRVNWKYDLRNPQISRPTVEGGRIFVTTTDDTVYAFDASTGKWLWHYPRRSTMVSTVRSASAPRVDGNEVLVGLSDGFLVALGLQDGSLKWERRLQQGSRFIDVDAHPEVSGGVIYVPSYDGALYALKRQGGQVLWRVDAGGSKQVVIEGDRIYLPSSDGNLYAIQKESGKIIWKFEMDGGVPTRLVSTEKQLIFGSSHQYLYVVDKASGKGLWRFNSGYGSGFSGSPLWDPAQKRLYALSGAGNLYSFQAMKIPPKRPRGSSDPFSFGF